jgi:hypothetical protein
MDDARGPSTGVVVPSGRWGSHRLAVLRDVESGASSVASVFGVAIFLGFMLFSTQVLVHLYASSTVTAVAFDTARRASGLGGDCAASEADALARLGSWGAQSDVLVRCRQVGDSTEVTISGPSPARGLRVFGAGVVDRIERGASFRTETGL